MSTSRRPGRPGPALLLACRSPPAAATATAAATAAPRTITVLAAASLTGPSPSSPTSSRRTTRASTVKLAFDSSATLAQQAVDGAPADVLATADTATMDSAARRRWPTTRRSSPPTRWCWSPRRTTRPGSPRSPTSTAPTSTYVACVDDRARAARSRPRCSRTTASPREPASLEVDVKSVLAKVTSDEADAGLRLRHRRGRRGRPGRDASRSRDAADELTTYPIATAAAVEGRRRWPRQFVDLVLSDDRASRCSPTPASGTP